MNILFGKLVSVSCVENAFEIKKETFIIICCIKKYDVGVVINKIGINVGVFTILHFFSLHGCARTRATSCHESENDCKKTQTSCTNSNPIGPIEF